MMEQRSEKTMVAAALLCFFLGGFSAHRFYSGKIGTALFQMALVIAGVIMVASSAAGAMTGGSGVAIIPGVLCLGGAGTWVFVDFITILVGKFRDGDGKVIKS